MGMPKDGRRQAARPLLGDEAELFREFNHEFVRGIQRRTDSSQAIVDDACAVRVAAIRPAPAGSQSQLARLDVGRTPQMLTCARPLKPPER
jgi:hypothetical protein